VIGLMMCQAVAVFVVGRERATYSSEVLGRSFSAVPELLINLAGRGRRRGGGEEGEEGEGEDSSQ
jgi:hypothetical protein